MNPYYTLGVPSSATEAEIKSAYQRLLTQLDSDGIQTEETIQRLQEVTEAYDILSNPIQKAEYDRTPFFAYEEDPREIYRREYINRKREAERLKKIEVQRLSELAVTVKRILYKIIRFLSFPILGFASVLVIDSFLPEITYHEPAEIGWQERHGKSRRSSGYLVSYMKTEHFVMAVPDDIHVGYDYYAKNRTVLAIGASPIFKIPKRISFTRNNLYYEVVVQHTIYASRTLCYILLSSSLFFILRKNYSELNFILCLLPVILTVYAILKIYLI